MVKVMLKKGDLAEQDITRLCTSLRLSGDFMQCARTLEMEIAYALFDPNQRLVEVEAGCTIKLFNDGEVIFGGVVFDRSTSTGGSSNTMRLTVYGFAIYLLKSRRTINFESADLNTVVNEVCRGTDILIGDIPSISHKVKKVFNDKDLYSIIKEVLEDIEKITKKKYMIQMDQKKINIIEIGRDSEEIVLQSGANIIGTEYSDNINDMVNHVKKFDINGAAIPGALEAGELIKKYGRIQAVCNEEKDKNIDKVAKNMIKGLIKTIRISLIGNHKLVTGKKVDIKVPYFNLSDGKTWFVETDVHTWESSSGAYTTEVTVTHEL